MTLKQKHVIAWSLSFLAMGGVIAWSFSAGFLRFNYPSRSRYPVQGLDISHHQGKIDWDVAARQGFQFIYLKATEGGDWVDPQFKAFWQAARERGMAVGAYHFYRICKNGVEQANHFIATVPKRPDSLPPAIDLEFGGNCRTEKSKEEILGELSVFVAILRYHYGKPPIIYATEEFYDAYLINQLPATGIWIRNIFHTPRLPDGRKWVIWQYANRGRVEGIENNVDLNAFWGSEQQFKSFINADGKMPD